MGGNETAALKHQISWTATRFGSSRRSASRDPAIGHQPMPVCGIRSLSPLTRESLRLVAATGSGGSVSGTRVSQSTRRYLPNFIDMSIRVVPQAYNQTFQDYLDLGIGDFPRR